MIQSILLVIVLIVLWCVSFYWHFRENRIITAQFRRNVPLHRKQEKMLLLGRSAQCLALLAICFLLMVMLMYKAQKPCETSAPASCPQPAPTLPAIPAPVSTNSGNAADETSLNDLKERYESVLINHFLLKQCGKSNDEEYKLIMNAMQIDLTNQRAPINMMQNILVAAKGSYTEIYSRIPCTQDVLGAQEAQFHNYISRLRGTKSK